MMTPSRKDDEPHKQRNEHYRTNFDRARGSQPRWRRELALHNAQKNARKKRKDNQR